MILLAVELCRHLDSFSLKVKGISDRRMLAGQAVQGAVALTDSGIRRRGDTNRRQLQAQEYAGKLQEILARAAVSEPEEQEVVVGEAEALADLELGAEEGRALLAAHPGANSRSAFAQVEEPAYVPFAIVFLPGFILVIIMSFSSCRDGLGLVVVTQACLTVVK